MQDYYLKMSIFHTGVNIFMREKDLKTSFSVFSGAQEGEFIEY